jgi:hypothetical protein
VDLNKIPLNPLNAELNPICYLLALLGAHPILHVSRIRVNVLERKRICAVLFRNMEFITIYNVLERK